MKFEITKGGANWPPALRITSEPGDSWEGETSARFVSVVDRTGKSVPEGRTGTKVLKCGSVKGKGGKQVMLLLVLDTRPDLVSAIAEWEAAIQAQKDAKDAAEKAEFEAIRSGEKPITLHYHDGEHLSGWSVHGPAADLLEEIGLCRGVEVWGRCMENDAVKALGESFTFPQAMEFARPALNAKAAKAREAEEAEAAKYAEAKDTGKPVEMKQWTEPCDGTVTECSWDHVTRYAMPDGSTKVTRAHTH